MVSTSEDADNGNSLGRVVQIEASRPEVLTKADLIADTLRDEIMAGICTPGLRLQQADLAIRFQTSITPVREALKRLEVEGLLTGRAHHGVTVARPQVEQITSIFVMRHQIEPLAAQRAAVRLTRRDFERAREVNTRLAAASTTDGAEIAARALNREFHFIFYGGCELPTLTQEIERLWAAFPWAALQVRGMRQRLSEIEHFEMLEAVEQNDSTQIRETFERHIQHGFLALMKQIGGSTSLPDPLTEHPITPSG